MENALATYLRTMQRMVPPCPSFAGILTEASGPPDDNTSPFYFFYYDTAADVVYINPTRTSAAWIALLSADVSTGTILTADV